MERFEETSQEADAKRRGLRDKELSHQREIRDFIPYKVAKRIKEFIAFSVKLDGRCPEFHLDENTTKLLNQIDEEKRKEEELEMEWEREQELLELEGEKKEGEIGIENGTKKPRPRR